MRPVLMENPVVVSRFVPLTVEQYHSLGENGLLEKNVELLEGVVVQKMPKSPRHVVATETLKIELQGRLSEGYYVREEKPLTLFDSEPEPDLAVVNGTSRDYIQAHPRSAALVIEVALSSLELDREKARLYAAASILEYWIVDLDSETVIVHRRPGQGGYDEIIRRARDEELPGPAGLLVRPVLTVKLFPGP